MAQEGFDKSGKYRNRIDQLARTVYAIERRQWPTPHGFSKDGKSNGPSGNELGYAVNRSTWPTPSASSREETVSGGHPGLAGGSGARHKLYEMLGYEEGKKMGCQSISPDWVSWLMGWPIGWSSLEPLTDLIWLSWEVDPADGERPEAIGTPQGEADSKNAVRQDAFKRGRVPTPVEYALSTKPSTGPIPRVATGIKDRVNRLKALGNGQVPQCAAEAFKILWGAIVG